MRTESTLEKVLAAGHLAVTSECGPPRGTSAAKIRKKAELLRQVVDAVNVTDNQTAMVRMSSFAACVFLRQLGLHPVLQMVSRDRNRLAMQSDILGAYAHGIDTMLCLSGDHPRFGDHPMAANVHDVDSVQMLQMVKESDLLGIHPQRDQEGRRDTFLFLCHLAEHRKIGHGQGSFQRMG